MMSLAMDSGVGHSYIAGSGASMRGRAANAGSGRRTPLGYVCRLSGVGSSESGAGAGAASDENEKRPNHVRDEGATSLFFSTTTGARKARPFSARGRERAGRPAARTRRMRAKMRNVARRVSDRRSGDVASTNAEGVTAEKGEACAARMNMSAGWLAAGRRACWRGVRDDSRRA